jgi:hypothetical protein
MSRDRDTYIHRKGVTPETTSVISLKNKIYAIPSDGETTAHQIGVVATFSPTESRTVEPVRGIGFGDHVAELVPGYTDPMTISVDRTAQYLSNLYQVFGYKGGIDGIVRSLRHHKWPFDIVQELVISQLVTEKYTSSYTTPKVDTDSVSDFGNGQQLDAILTYYQGCWLSDFSTSYTSDTALVQESVTVNVTDIVSSPDAVGYEDDTDADEKLFNTNAISQLITNSDITAADIT